MLKDTSKRLVYSKYELANLVKRVRLKNQLSLDEFAKRNEISVDFLESIENASIVFNKNVYLTISKITKLSLEELLKKEDSSELAISYRTNTDNDSIKKATQIAELIFDEAILQIKASQPS